MRTKLVLAVLVAVCVLVAGSPVFAKGTAKEAVALVDKAGQYIKANGLQKAYEAFNDQKGQFVKDDLYIFTWSMEGVVTSHGANKPLIGKNVYELKDPDGKTFVKEGIALAKEKGTGWVDYKWSNPTTKKVEAKSTFVKYVPEHNIIICCGIYK